MREMDGLEIIDAERALQLVPAEMDWENAVPKNAELCALALCAKRQLDSPYVHIMRSRAYIALPWDKGREIPGRAGLWAMYRYEVFGKAREAIIAVDTGEASSVPAILELSPMRKSERPEEKQAKNRIHHNRPGTKPQTGEGRDDVLTKAGVRNYQGRTPH